MLHKDLAILCGMEARVFNQAVTRTIDRFPPDFMFQLDRDEFENLKSHFSTLSSTWGGFRKLPFAFAEHGALRVRVV